VAIPHQIDIQQGHGFLPKWSENIEFLTGINRKNSYRQLLETLRGVGQINSLLSLVFNNTRIPLQGGILI
jgi:hypothetical protein